MSNALTIPQESQDALANSDQETFSDLAKSGDYLPQIRLILASSPIAAGRQCQIGNFAFIRSKSSVIDVGEQVSVFPVAWRPLALDTNASPPVASFDPKSETFAAFKRQALADSNSGFLVGPQFLLWYPEQKSFVTFFMASKTLKNKAPELQSLIPQAVTLKSTTITKGKYTWYGPTITTCSLPLEVPTPEQINQEVQRFKNPPEKTVEVADTANQRADR